MSQSLPQSQVAWQLASPSDAATHLKLNQTAPVPQINKPNQTLIKVLSVALNPADYKLVNLGFISRFFVSFPHTPVMDFVGRVWSTTLPESEGIKAGDLVYGKHAMPVKQGALAQFTVVDGKDGVIKVPEGNQHEIDWYSTIGVAGLTALQELELKFGREENGGQGKSVFINGGSGGTGVFSIQIAKHVLRCDRVVVSCSGANAELCRSLGADEVIDYKSVNVVDGLKNYVATKNGGKKFDLIVDTVGHTDELYFASHHILEEGGIYGQIGALASLSAIKQFGKILLWPAFLGGGKRKWVFLTTWREKEGLTRLGQWMADGKLKGVVDETFAMEDAQKAFAKLKTGRVKGKLIIRVSEDGR